jgi:hypothetical protein
MARHPLFRLQARRVRWGGSSQRLWQYARRRLLALHLVLFAFWALFVALHRATAGLNGLVGNRLTYYDNPNFVNLLFLIAIAADILLDFRCIQAAVRTINGDIETGRWDLLRLTALNRWGIVRAKYGSADSDNLARPVRDAGRALSAAGRESKCGRAGHGAV